MSPQLQQIGVINRWRKVIARQFRAGTALLGAVVHKLEQVDLLA
jgi:hypothetical protein